MRDEFSKHRCPGQECRRLLEAAEKTVSRSFLCLGFIVSQSVIVSRMACLFCGAECVVRCVCGGLCEYYYYIIILIIIIIIIIIFIIIINTKDAIRAVQQNFLNKPQRSHAHTYTSHTHAAKALYRRILHHSIRLA